MSTAQAREVLGLTGNYTADDVKKAYREKAKANHPDMGGSEEKMKDVNAAYELLQSTSGKASNRIDWDEIAKEYSKLRDQINDIIQKSLDKEAFLKYFEGQFDVKFKVDYEKYYGEKERNPSFAGVSIKFSSEDDMVTFVLDATVYLVNIRKNNALGGSSELSIPLSVSGVGFFNARKFKLFDKSWGNTMQSIDLNNPSEYFPADKLKKHSTKKDRTKATRKDFVTAIATVLKGKSMSDKDSFMVPVEGNTYLSLSRNTFMRTGSWRIRFYTKMSEYRYLPAGEQSDYWSFLEDASLLDTILSIKGKDMGAIRKILNKHKDSVDTTK